MGSNHSPDLADSSSASSVRRSVPEGGCRGIPDLRLTVAPDPSIGERCDSVDMKTRLFYSALLAAALSAGVAQGDENKPADKKSLGEKASDTLQKTGKVIADDTKKVGSSIKNAVMPESDARKVDVTLTGRHIEMSKEIAAGKTAFVVRNEGKEKQGFKIEGKGLEKEFMIAVAPNDSKTLNVDLKPGEYKVFVPSPGNNAEPKGRESMTLTVK